MDPCHANALCLLHRSICVFELFSHLFPISALVICFTICIVKKERFYWVWKVHPYKITFPSKWPYSILELFSWPAIMYNALLWFGNIVIMCTTILEESLLAEGSLANTLRLPYFSCVFQLFLHFFPRRLSFYLLFFHLYFPKSGP